jgi:hypothetical protein
MTTRSPQVTKSIVNPWGRVAAILLVGCFFGCSDSHPDVRSELPPGDPCKPISLECKDDAWLCVAVGMSSSCQDRGLCLGDGTGMTCAPTCTSDAECASLKKGLVCMLDCQVPIMNGFCHPSSVHAEIIARLCVDGDPRTDGAATACY